MINKSNLVYKKLVGPGKILLRNYLNEKELLSEKSHIHYSKELDFPVNGEYFLSTDRGIFCLKHNSIRQLSKQNCFGIAVDDESVFTAGINFDSSSSFIYKGNRRALDQVGLKFSWKPIYEIPLRDGGERIHQISLLGNALWIANTANNSYLKINASSGEWLSEICPFRCAYDQRIKRDHNHVNSISSYPEYLFFGAWRANMQGCFGLIGEGKIEYFSYSNAGIHDCHFFDDGVFFSDSFRFDVAESRGPNGTVIKNGRMLDKEYFDENDVGCVRGMAGTGKELVVGLSFPGGRSKRYSGEGGLLLMHDEKTTHRISLPCAQVYDIVRSDGRTFDESHSPSTFGEASQILRRSLGNPVDEWNLRDSLMPRDLNVSLSGLDESSIDEYL